MRTKAHAVRVAAALLIATAACKSSAPELTDAGAWKASSASPALPGTTKKIARADCAQWARHASEVLLRDWKASADGCPDAERETTAARLEEQRVSIREGAQALCEQHVGESYATRDGQCFSSATTFTAMSACAFAPMTSSGDTDMAAVFARQRETCAQHMAGAPEHTP